MSTEVVYTVVNRRIFLKTMSASSVTGMAILSGCSSNSSSGASGGRNGSKTARSAGSGEKTTAGSEGSASTQTNASATGAKTVEMHTEDGNYYFDPIGLFVEKGTTVTFEDKSGSHSSTAYKKGTASAETTRIPKDAKAWNSDTITEGETFEHTFDTEGTYDYFCIPHKSLGMVGRIIVGSSGGPAEGSMPPDGKVPKSDKIIDKGSIAHSDFS